MLFELEDVTLRRDGREVLSGLSAGVPAGASAIVGPSGSGKSTVLRLLNRLADPQTGQVRHDGRDIKGLDPLRLRCEVSLVPQLPALLDGTVEHNIRFAARLAGREADPARVLELAGLGASYASRDAARLSVGEQQRAMLARALAQEPRVLLLDEPTSALDARATDAVEATLRDLRERLDISTVLVSHDPEQARRMADWVVRVDGGRATACGPAREILGA